jgi:hypothetical protein
MRIAVVGSGIAGLGAAYLLSSKHEVTLFESEPRLGGHTHTHEISLDGRDYAIDTGFIVFNPNHYPLLTKLFAELAVESQATVMSFAARNEATGLEYNATDLNRLFVQRSNLFKPSFVRMVLDIVRFYRSAGSLLQGDGEGPTLGDYLRERGYSEGFKRDHLVPMASALWSSPNAEIEKFPARYLVQFLANHQMLALGKRAPWRVVKGGSNSYLKAMQQRWRVRVQLNAKVERVRRVDEGGKNGVIVSTADHHEHFDQVLLACHSDQALAMLAEPTVAEREILGAIQYQANDTVLHTDTRLLPRNPKAWAAWNAHIPAQDSDQCTVSYCMNLLQGIESQHTFVVSLNCTKLIDPKKVLRRMQYHHPLFSHGMVNAQKRRAEINGVDRIWFAGAYWGFGFHEDGLRSAVEVVRALGVNW